MLRQPPQSARCKLDELFAQFDNVTTACPFHNAILDSLSCLNVLSSEVIVNTV